MKPLILSLCLLLSIGLNAQLWKIGISLSPTAEYRTLYSDGQEHSNFIKSIRDHYEAPLPSFHLAVLAQRDIYAHWTLESGIEFARKGYFWRQELNTLQGSYLHEQNYVYNSLDIPCMVYRSFGASSWKIRAGIGLSIDLLIDGPGHLSQRVKSWEDVPALEANYNTFGLSPIISLGTSYQLNEYHSFNFALQGHRGLLRIIDTPVTAKLWSTGLHLSWFRLL